MSMCLCLHFTPLVRTCRIGLRAHPDTEGPHLDLITPAKTLFPKQVTSTAAVDMNLGGLLFNPVQGVCIQVEEGASEEVS